MKISLVSIIFSPLPVRKIQEGENRGAARTWAELCIRAIV